MSAGWSRPAGPSIVPGSLCDDDHDAGGFFSLGRQLEGLFQGRNHFRAAAALTGVENADEIRMGPNGPEFLSNHAGGILGGISTGQEVVVRFAIKPSSSILTPRRTITAAGEEVDLITKGRHDPCVGIRAVPVGEAMMACVLADHLLLDRGQTGGIRGQIG